MMIVMNSCEESSLVRKSERHNFLAMSRLHF